MKRKVWSLLATLLIVFGLVLWGAAALNYGDDVAIGKYGYASGGESCDLLLRPDHTFHQELHRQASTQHADGTWRRVGEGGVSLSKEFLPVRGDEPGPDGSTWADLHKALGLFPRLEIRQYFVLWYGKQTETSSIADTYKGDEPNVAATLVLNTDNTFHQTITSAGVEKSATGHWSQTSDGTVRFSSAFLKTSGEPLSPDETATSMDPRGSNLQIDISTESHAGIPVFRKRLLPW